jgi:phosphinothricin acetyltransferase
MKDKKTELIIDKMKEDEWSQVSAIYQEGIDTGNATFAVSPPVSWEEWCKNKINSCSIVAKENNNISGWAAVSTVSDKCV